METTLSFFSKCFRAIQNFKISRKSETLCERFQRYISEAYRDGVIGNGRYTVLKGKERKLQRFLAVKGLSAIRSKDFTSDLLMEYRKFIFDEYLYVEQNPILYPSGGDF